MLMFLVFEEIKRSSNSRYIRLRAFSDRSDRVANASTTTIPMFLYANARGGTTTPALNALASILVITTLIGVGVAYLAYWAVGRRTAPSGVSALRELSGLEATA